MGLAAEAAIEAASGPGERMQDLSVAFLAAGRTGPFVARAELLGGGTYRAELRDEGANQLLAAAVGVTGPGDVQCRPVGQHRRNASASRTVT